MSDKLLDLLIQATIDSVIECPNCATRLEADFDICGECGTKNPLKKAGLI